MLNCRPKQRPLERTLIALGTRRQRRPGEVKSQPVIAILYGVLVMGISFALVVLYTYSLRSSQRDRLVAVESTDARMYADWGQSVHREAPPIPSASKSRCTVWIAPPSLKSVKGGYGVFTTRDLVANERILPSYDGVAITVVNYWNDRERYRSERKSWIKLWNNYWWARGVPDHSSYEFPGDSVDYQIGFGALPNHHCTLRSLTYRYPETPYNDAMVDRFQDPTTGSFTYNMGREFLVKRHLKAGEELFLNYGYCERGKGPAWIQHSVMPQDVEDAVSIIRSYMHNTGPMTFDHSGQRALEKDVSGLVRDLLPTTQRELVDFLRASGTDTDLEAKVVERTLTMRSPEWIRENGICMENILPGPSTIQGAGQGAFANFPLYKGEMIVPAPLLHILDKKALSIYNDDGSRNGTQLLMNYCFGHSESSLLLCPNTNAVLINHCSKTMTNCGEGGPNAEYRWSRGWDSTSDAWRNMSLEEIATQDGRGLAFEIVATRNIDEGEEIFMDYGQDWERAWIQHVKTWRPPPRDPLFGTAKDANQNLGPIPQEFVAGDLRLTVQHSHLFTGCVYHVSSDDSHRVYRTPQAAWKEMPDDEIMAMYADNGSRFVYDTTAGYSAHHDRSHWPCTVIKRQSDGRYIVRVHPTPLKPETTPAWQTNRLPRLLYNYPRESIHFFVLPQASDQYLPGVFRHPIGVRDDIFPDQWRNEISS